MALNFNVGPYYDDFDPTKNFHRILFKPGYAVQARELTQSQTILQNQISQFASAIYSQNTPISGGKVTTNLNAYYIKLNYTDVNGGTVTASDFLNKVIQDSSGTILAKVVATAETTTSGSTVGDPPTLIVTYISGSQFTSGLAISCTDGTSFTAVVAQPTSTLTTSGTVTYPAVGKSSIASISEGVFYIVNGYSQSQTINPDGTYSKYTIGNFVNVSPQTIILDKYSNSPSYRIGLLITETIYDYVSDSSLLDPAIGASNYQAPGADRYVITLTLVNKPLTVGDDQNFVELVRMETGQVLKQVDSTVYSAIDDYFAKRTYDTNGDYIVDQFKFSPSSNTSGISSQYDLSVSKGVAYVRGYRVENQSPVKLTGNRARTTASANNNSVFVDYGTYLYVNTVKGSAATIFDITTMPSIDLHCVFKSDIVNGGSANATTYGSTVVGTAKIRNLKYDHYNGTTSNTASYVYKAQICDFVSKTLSSNATAGTANSISFYSVGGKFSSSNNAYIGTAITIDSGTGAGDSRKIIAYNGVTKTATVDANWSSVPNANSNFSLRFAASDIESLVIANAAYGLAATADVDVASKVGGIATGATQITDSAYPELLFKVGQSGVASIANSSYYTQTVFRNKSFSSTTGTTTLQISFDSGVTSVLDFEGKTGTALSASEILNLFTVFVKNKGTNASLNNGDIIDFTAAGRTVTVSSDKNTVTFTASDLTTTLVVDVVAKVAVQNADNSTRILKAKNLVTASNTVVSNDTGTQVNTNSYVSLSTGQVYVKYAGIVSPGQNQSLYVADVKRIVKIIDTGSSAVVPTVAMLSSSVYDVTSYYLFNNGQTDNYYDHASIALKPGAPKAKGNLLILFDFYSHGSGDGYFSIMSYLSPTSSSPEEYASIGNYTATNGTVYSLRDCIDFRPSRQNAKSDFVFEYTSDPTSSDAGALIPDNLTNYLSNYSYYLARKDLLVLTKDKSFNMIEGVPSVNPIYPAQPDGCLVIAQMDLDPYTAYVPGENPTGTLPNLSVKTVLHKRYTMQDISDLQTRINNIEYYTALNMLEQKASTTQIPDVNGLNRFKNGILVDDFSSFATADTNNPDWSASINKRTRQLTAPQIVTNFALQNSTVYGSLGNPASSPSYAISTVNKTTNLFTLPFTTANVVTQQLASSVINLNPFSVTMYQGVLDLNPPMDNWVDNTKAPDLLIVDPNLQVFQQSGTLNVLSTGDWKVVPGTTTTSVSQLTSSFSRVNHGAFNGPFGWLYGYTQTDVATTTTTYGTMSQTNTLGYYTNIGSTYSLNNNYITDISILPYIRPQQILVKAKGLQVNTPLTTFFDGTNVDQYMINPDSIELYNVTGTFNEGDVVGYYQLNKFYPIATIVTTYVYPSTSAYYNPKKVRLYITGNFHTAYAADLPISTLQNAKLDSSGNYVSGSSTASGTLLTTNKPIAVHKSGFVGAVGGTFTDVLGSTLRYYMVSVNHGAFADAYGIWGDSRANGLTLPYGKFNFTAPSAGNYYMRMGADDAKTGFIKVNGTTYWTSTSSSGGSGATADVTVPLLAGNNTFEISVTSSEQDGDAYIAAAISSAPWGTGTDTSGNIILTTRTLQGNTTPLNVGTMVEMPGGGLFYIGVTKLALNGVASNVSSYYVGSKIGFNSVYISLDPFGKVQRNDQTHFATILTYDNLTSTVTLDTPVNISVGGNIYIGGGADLTSFYSINGTATNYSLGLQQGTPCKLSTDESGTFVGIFNVPANKFRTGDRTFRIDNRLVATDPGTATSYAEGTFTASGLSTKSQALDFGASVSGAKNTFTQTKYLSNQLIGVQTTVDTSYTVYDPVAQTFIVQRDNFPNGVFLRSISVFFKSKPTTTNVPVTLSVVGTLNGYPDGNTLDYAIASLTPDKVKTSDTPHYLDPNTKTTFTFDAPVYIQPGVLYAFILKSSSQDYNVYYAAQNGTAIPSTAKVKPTDATPSTVTKIGAAPYVGSLFESQNGITWTADQSKSLMMIIDRCVFDIASTPTVPFIIPKNLPYRKTTTGDVKTFLNANNTSNFGTYAGKDVESHAYNITTTEFSPTTTGVIYTYNPTLKNGQIKAGADFVSPGKFGSPTYDDIYLSDGLGPRLLMANTNDSFILNAVLGSKDSSVSPVISDDGLTIYNIQSIVNNLELSNSQIVLTNAGAGYNSPTPNANVTISAPDISGGTQALAAANVVGGVIQSVYITNPGSGYLAKPTITITGANTTQATATITSEFDAYGGNAYCKYFTKKVVMTPGNDSQDLRVFYTAYRPNTQYGPTAIYVFYKILNSNDTSKFEDNGWQLMTTVGDNKNAYSTTRDDLYEYEAAPGIYGTANNNISYTSVNGTTYNSFIQFAIKVVITTPDKTTVPFLGELRAIALPSGTGL